MNSMLLITGSFATAWLVIWLASALALLLLYPLVRKALFRWHPARASNMLLILLAFPFLFSLIITVMLFMPIAEGNLVSAHCHEFSQANCESHFPLVNSLWMGIAGLVISALIITLALRQLIFNLRTARRLMSQLLHLGEDTGKWLLLNESQPVVFTLGWWRSKVFVTRGLLQECSEQNMSIILRHEFEHARRFDNVRLLLAKLFLLVLPARLADRLYADLHFLTESACDFAAAEQHGELEVAETLLRVQKLVPREFNLLNNTLLSAFTGSEVEQRIRSLTAGSGQFLNLRYGQTVFTLLFILLSIALVDPMHHGIEWLLDLP